MPFLSEGLGGDGRFDAAVVESGEVDHRETLGREAALVEPRVVGRDAQVVVAEAEGNPQGLELAVPRQAQEAAGMPVGGRHRTVGEEHDEVLVARLFGVVLLFGIDLVELARLAAHGEGAEGGVLGERREGGEREEQERGEGARYGWASVDRVRHGEGLRSGWGRDRGVRLRLFSPATGGVGEMALRFVELLTWRARMDLVAQLVETWQIHHRIHGYLLAAIAPEHLGNVSASKGRSTGEQLAHVHNVRLMWLKSAAPDLLAGLEKIEKAERRGPRPARCRARRLGRGDRHAPRPGARG